MKKFIFFIFFISGICYLAYTFMITSELTSMKDVQNAIIQFTKSKNPLEKKASSASSVDYDDEYLSSKFWRDGNEYKITNSKIKVYTDPNLTKKKKKGYVIVSPVVSKDILENGQKIYTVLTDKGFAYMSKKPRLKKI